MGKLMIRCPKTGDAIFTGLTADKERFAVMPVFFGRALCAACGATHEWFARDAWVHDDPPVPRGSSRPAGQVRRHLSLDLLVAGEGFEPPTHGL